ncbi:MAG: hypothetical protein R6V03_03530 [Kiritimatiellia bacterium]
MEKYLRIFLGIFLAVGLTALISCELDDDDVDDTETTDETTETAEEDDGGDDGGGGVSGGSSWFVWKTEPESSSGVVCLPPEEYTGKADTMTIHTDLPATDKNKLDTARPADPPYKGYWDAYRFSKEGSHYGGPIYVVLNLSSGSKVAWYIANAAVRHDYTAGGRGLTTRLGEDQ